MKDYEKIKFLHSSGLKLYQECPFKFYIQYILGENLFGENVALQMGTDFHLGMEEMYKSGDFDKANSVFRDNVLSRHGNYQKTQIDNLSRNMKAYYNFHFDINSSKVVAQEVNMSCRLKYIDVPITGRIDVLLTDGIIDFKTTSFRDKDKIYNKKQLVTYAMLFFNKYKILPRRVEIHAFNKLRSDIDSTSIFTEDITIDDVNILVLEYQQLWKDIKNERWTPN
jgi:ATP-dependent helicase/DNAse subunit B